MGRYTVEAEYVLAADGCNSAIRSMLGLDFMGRIFEERFLITDVVTPVELPNERRFWFDPPFHNGQSALLHRQPDNMYRIDLQLGSDADPELEKRPERVIPRIQAVLGERTPFELEWVSVYTFQCRRLERFVHDRVVFVGDSAHVVSPFGARGGNGGIQDADNLVWKLAMVLKGEAPRALLETYDEERVHGADENIRNSARATNFMTPKSAIERAFRDGVLALAADLPFARRLVNSGRLSVPCALAGMRLQTPDDDEVEGPMAPGSPCIDAPVTRSDGRPGWLLEHLGGAFTVLYFGCDAASAGRSARARQSAPHAASRARERAGRRHGRGRGPGRPHGLGARALRRRPGRDLSDPAGPARRRPVFPPRSRSRRSRARARHSRGGRMMAEQAVQIDDGFAGKGDDFYEALIRAHEGLSEGESDTLNARLVLILANHIGDLGVLEQALALARRSLDAQ